MNDLKEKLNVGVKVEDGFQTHYENVADSVVEEIEVPSAYELARILLSNAVADYESGLSSQDNVALSSVLEQRCRQLTDTFRLYEEKREENLRANGALSEDEKIYEDSFYKQYGNTTYEAELKKYLDSKNFKTK